MCIKELKVNKVSKVNKIRKQKFLYLHMHSKVSQTEPINLNWQSLSDEHAHSQVAFPSRTTHFCPCMHVKRSHSDNGSGNCGTQFAFPSSTTHLEYLAHNV